MCVANHDKTVATGKCQVVTHSFLHVGKIRQVIPNKQWDPLSAEYILKSVLNADPLELIGFQMCAKRGTW